MYIDNADMLATPVTYVILGLCAEKPWIGHKGKFKFNHSILYTKAMLVTKIFGPGIG